MKRAREMSGLYGLQDRLACWFARHRQLREFDALGADESERLMQDLGLSISDMAAIARPHAGLRRASVRRRATRPRQGAGIAG